MEEFIAGYYWVQYKNSEKTIFIARLSLDEGVPYWSIFGHDIEVPFDSVTILEGPLKCLSSETCNHKFLKSFEAIEPVYKRKDRKPVTLEEIINCFVGYGGTVTINPTEFAVIQRATAGRFNPITMVDLLKTGFVATFDEILSIYISRKIPIGYYLWGHFPELHTQWIDGLIIQPHLSSKTIQFIQRKLEIFE